GREAAGWRISGQRSWRRRSRRRSGRCRCGSGRRWGRVRRRTAGPGGTPKDSRAIQGRPQGEAQTKADGHSRPKAPRGVQTVSQEQRRRHSRVSNAPLAAPSPHPLPGGEGAASGGTHLFGPFMQLSAPPVARVVDLVKNYYLEEVVV